MTGGPVLARLRRVLRLGGLRRMLAVWRRSILVRMVVTNVVLSALAVGLVGWLALVQTRDALLDHRVEATLGQVREEVAEAESRLDAAAGADLDASAQRSELVEPIIERGLSRGFWVVLAGPVSDPADGAGGRIADGGVEWSPGFDTSSVPAGLEDHFQRPNAASAWTYADLRTGTGAIAHHTPGIAVGSQIILPASGGTYNLYLLFPLTQEQQALHLITRGLVGAGLFLIVLVGAASWLIGRRVVTPIRLARQTAERLAAGRLEERMVVTGEDDLARLAVSFNQMANNLQNQIRQLENLSRVQRRFTSDVSHELRTPLTTVRMASDVLHDARDQFDPATARAAELLQTELDRFETLLVDLLEISRFDAGAAVLDIDDVDLVDVARRVVDSLGQLAAKRGVRLVMHTPGHPCLAEADVRRVERILRNLVANAIDHVADSDGIDLYVAGDSHAAAVAVRDHGVGLAPGEAAMVFNRFWRSDPARDRASGGTGLGLSIALEDARLHGGWLQAWGRPSEGAQFRLTLPRRIGGALRHSPLPLVPPDAIDHADRADQINRADEAGRADPADRADRADPADHADDAARATESAP